MRFIKLTAATETDRKQLLYLLDSRNFFPTTSSSPALPGAYDDTFDYRAFFKIAYVDRDGMPVVFMREELAALPGDFTDMIPAAYWVTAGLSGAPTPSEITYDEVLDSGHSVKTTTYTFLSWNNYPNFKSVSGNV